MLEVKDHPAARRKPKTAHLVATIAEVAEFFGVSAALVNSWRREALPMPGRAGRFDLSKVVQWERARRKDTNAKPDALKAVEIRLKTSQADAKEFDNAVAAGEFLSKHDVELWAAQAIIEFRELVMALPEMLATSSPPELRSFIREETDRHCRDSLVALNRRLESRELDDQVTSETAHPATTARQVG